MKCEPSKGAINPIVSVILPVFNCESYIEEAIQSILEQEIPLELIIVDDGSTDGSGRIAQSHVNQIEESPAPAIRYIRQENKGVAAARNTGIGAANCELLAFIDADDLWTPGKLKRQVEFLSGRPEVACVIGKIQMFFDRKHLHDAEERTHTDNTESSPSKILYGEPYYCYVFGSAVIRRSVSEIVGLLDESMKISEDTEWFFRLKDQFRLETIDFLSLLYRYRRGSLSSGKSFKELNILPLLKQSLDRRRSKREGGIS